MSNENSRINKYILKLTIVILHIFWAKSSPNHVRFVDNLFRVATN